MNFSGLRNPTEKLIRVYCLRVIEHGDSPLVLINARTIINRRIEIEIGCCSIRTSRYGKAVVVIPPFAAFVELLGFRFLNASIDVIPCGGCILLCGHSPKFCTEGQKEENTNQSYSELRRADPE